MSNKPIPDGFATLYANMLPMCIKAARDHGYCFAIHGSLAADLDAVCVPWVDDAADEGALIRALTNVTGCFCLCGEEISRSDGINGPKLNPHNRRTYTLSFGGAMYMDITVMPKIVNSEAKL